MSATTTEVHTSKLARDGKGGYTASHGFFRVQPWVSPVDPSTRWGWHLLIERTSPGGAPLTLIDSVATLAEVRDLIATIYAEGERTAGISLSTAALRCTP